MKRIIFSISILLLIQSVDCQIIKYPAVICVSYKIMRNSLSMQRFTIINCTAKRISHQLLYPEFWL